MVNIFKELRKTIIKKLNGNMMTMSHQKCNINTEMLKKNQVEIVELKITITKMKNSLDRRSSIELTEEEMSKLEDGSAEIMQSGEQREKRRKENEYCLREMRTLLRAATYT